MMDVFLRLVSVWHGGGALNAALNKWSSSSCPWKVKHTEKEAMASGRQHSINATAAPAAAALTHLIGFERERKMGYCLNCLAPFVLAE